MRSLFSLRESRRAAAGRNPARGRLSVESLEDRLPPAVFTVTTADDAGAGSLRRALHAANTIPGTDTVRFDIPGAGVHTIDLVSPLPAVRGRVALDGATQPGFAGTPLIELNGGAVLDGLDIFGSGSVVNALAIQNFPRDGVLIAGARGVTVSGCVISGNGDGVRIEHGSKGNVIGGTAPGW